MFMLNGVEIRIDARYDTDFGYMEKEQRETLTKVLAFLDDRPYRYDYGYSRRYMAEEENPRWVPFITVKSNCDEETRDLINVLPWRFGKDRVVTHREFEICTTHDCYQPTIAEGKGCNLFETDMESIHEIHCACEFHASEEASQIASTMEVTNDTVGRSLWTKVFSFQQMDNQFYAQRVQQVDEGVLYPTPWVGPLTAREQAIEAARDYEEE